MPPHLEIRHLTALVTIADEGSLRAAAQRLGCSQSTLSERLQELESALETRLVRRRSRSEDTRLTATGRVLLAHAEVVLGRIEAAHADIAALERVDLRVGVYGGAPLRLLPALIERTSDLRITPYQAQNDLELLSAVRFGRIDISFASLPLPAGPFDYIRLLEEPYVLLVGHDHPIAAADSATDHGATDLVAYSSKQALRGIAGRSLGTSLRIVERTDSDQAIRELVLSGAGAALLPQQNAEGTPQTVSLSLESLLPLHTTVLAWNRYRQLPAAATRFREAAAEIFARLAQGDH